MQGARWVREEDKKIKAKTIAEDSEEDEEDVIVGAIKVTDEELIELPAQIHLNLSDLEVEHSFERIHSTGVTQYRLYMCRPTDAAKANQKCPCCGHPRGKEISHANFRRRVHDLPTGLVVNELAVYVPKYECINPQCPKQTFVHQFSSIPPRRQMTMRLEDYLFRKSFECSFESLAEECGMTGETISTIFHRKIEPYKKAWKLPAAPRVLGIDEVCISGVGGRPADDDDDDPKFSRKKPRGVFMNIETRELLAFTPNVSAATVKETIMGMPGWENIEIVTMDMAGSYKSYIQDILPGAKIIVDKFHVIQNLNRKSQTCRKLIIQYWEEKIPQITDPQESIKKKSALALLKKYRGLFKYSYESLLNDHEDLLDILEEISAELPEVDYLRNIKHSFESIYKSLTRQQADEALHEWSKLIPPSGARQEEKWRKRFNIDPSLFETIKTFKNSVSKRWREEFLAYFEPKCRVTNATVEGKNNLIRKIERIGNGYSWDVLWAKVMLRDMVLVHGNFVLKARLEATTKVAGGKLIRPVAATNTISDLTTQETAFRLLRNSVECKSFHNIQRMQKLNANDLSNSLFDFGYKLVFDLVSDETISFYEPYKLGTDGFRWDNIADNLADPDKLDENDSDADLFLIGDYVKECLREIIIIQQAQSYAKEMELLTTK